MPGNLEKLVIPTGYESQQRAIETRRKLAELMLEKGLTSNDHMTSWAQVLAQMADAWAGKSMQKEADKAENTLGTQIRGDYSNQLGGFFKDVNGGMSEKGLTEKYAGSPMLQDVLKAHSDAYAASLKEAGEHTTFGGQYRTKGSIPEGTVDPNSMVIPGPGNSWAVNPVRATAALSAQYPPENSSPGNMTYSMPAPNGAGPMQQPGMQQPPPQGGMPPDRPGAESLNLDLLNPQEKQILQNELQRRAGSAGAGGNSYTLQNDMHTPMGSPLDARKPPAGVVNGKPYWIVNGVPFDNPEGK